MVQDKRKYIPISRAVNAALIDDYADTGRSKEQYTHWAVRVLKNLTKQSLKTNRKRVLIPVNQNTKTATLPPDFDQETFVGFIDGDNKVSINMMTKLVSECSIEEMLPDQVCERCAQDKSICNDLDITVSETTVNVNGVNAIKTITKKLYPNGDYFLVTDTPYYNYVTDAIETAPIKQFITNFELNSCGCLSDTPQNKELLHTCATDVYNCHYAECSGSCDKNMGGYNILPEMGLIQLTNKFTEPKLYLEYNGFLEKRNGQYVVPDVAFEAIVEGTKEKAIRNKPNVSMNTKLYYKQNYNEAVGHMRKIMGRVPLSMIIDAITRVPKFDITFDYEETCYKATANPYTTQINTDVCESYATNCSGGGSGIGTKHISPFQLAVIADATDATPTDGSFTYLNAALVGALDVNFILVNNAVENSKTDFTFDSATGTITRNNPWFEGDVLILPYAKLV